MVGRKPVLMAISRTAFLVALSCCAGGLYAYPLSDFREQIEVGRRLAGTGHYVEAENAFRSTLNDAEKQNEPVWAALALDSLGLLYQSLGRYLDAEKMLKSSMLLFERSEGRDAPDSALIRSNLASLYVSTRRYSQAESLLHQSVKILENTPKAENALADALSYLGCIYALRKKLTQAEWQFHRALDVVEKSPEKNEVQIATFLSYLSFTALLEKRYSEAAQLSERSTRILAGVAAPPAQTSILAFRMRAEVELKTGNLDKAQSWLQRAIAIAESAYGGDHPQVGRILLEYASLLRKLNRKNEAKQTKARAEAIFAKQQDMTNYVVDVSELLKP